jgi:hypothetical protein
MHGMSNQRLRPLFVNESERVLDRLLVNTCKTFDARPHTKVRLGDVVDFSQSGISNEDFRYATRAHLDFIITQGDQSQPVLGVEMDGGAHRDMGRQSQDRLKDNLCELAGLPLLRLDTSTLVGFGPYQLASYLVGSWFLKQSFDQEHEAGMIDRHEGFSPEFFTDGREFPWMIDQKARSRIVKAWQADLLAEGAFWIPATMGRPFRGLTSTAYASLQLRDESFLLGRGHVQLTPKVENLTGVRSWRLAEAQAVFDLGERLAAHVTRREPTTSAFELTVELSEFFTEDGWRVTSGAKSHQHSQAWDHLPQGFQ